MDTITVVIPTRNRYEKLRRCLNTIPRHDWLKVFVYFDGCPVPVTRKNGLERIDEVFHSTLNVGSVAARNYMARFVEDGLLWATDDIRFYPEIFEDALRLSNKLFPADDGVIGFRQEGNNFHPTGVGLMGITMLRAYPAKQFLFPEYWLFACQEIQELAEYCGSFYLMETVGVYHHHPIHHKKEMDQTHHEGRKHKARDRWIREFRKKNGFIWGLSNDRI